MPGRSRTRSAGWCLLLAGVNAVLGCARAPLPPETQQAHSSAGSSALSAAIPDHATDDQPDNDQRAAMAPGAAHDPQTFPELLAVPESVREELSLFAHATLHIQRVKVLQERGIQRQFQLTADQVARLSAVHEEVETLSSMLQRLRPEERQAKLQNEFRPKAEEFARLVDAELNTSQQRELFREVVRRQRGAITFLLPGVPEELELTGAQRAKLFTTIEETRQSVNFDNLYNPLELARLVAKSNAARATAWEMLSPDQRLRFNALTGQ